MAEVTLGFRLTLSFTSPAVQGHPRAKKAVDIGMPTIVATQAEAQARALLVRQAMQAVELDMIDPAGPGLPPGGSNLTFSTSIEKVVGDFATLKMRVVPV